MTTYYVDSAAGSNTSPYDTWAKAATALATIAAIDAAGDDVYVASTHAESTAGTLVLTFAGTAASPVRIICADKTSGEPPTTIATGASVTTTGTGVIGILTAANGGLYVYGIDWHCSTGAASADIGIAGTNTGQRMLFERCNFFLKTTTTGRVINVVGNGTGSQVRFKNCGVSFAANGQQIRSGGFFIWEGGEIISGSTAQTAGLVTLGTGTTQTSVFQASGIDLSNGGSGMFLYAVSNSNGTAYFRNCKMPASWTQTNIASGTLFATSRYEYFNCSSGDHNYRFGIQTYSATMTEETTLVKTGGASDGTTPLSWKIVTTANARYSIPFRSTEIVKWNSTVGSAITVTVDILHDSVTNLTDKEIWLDVQYLGTSGVPLSTYVNDGVNILQTGSDQASSSSTWTTTGMSNPNKQKLSVTFTPQEVGYIHAYITCAKASKTVYVDPELVVT